MNTTGATVHQQKLEPAPAVSLRFTNGTLVEVLYDVHAHRTAFALSCQGSQTIQNDFEDAGQLFVPFSPRNNLIANEAVLLPSEPLDYGTEELLISDIRAFIHRFVDLSPAFETIATYYVLFTWLYDAFNELPYLRLRGDFGSGKTRALLAIGSLCYKPFFASGASTVSPIFHTLNAFRGTLVFDEADFRFSDEGAEIVKILNNGNVRGLPVLRTMMNRQREFNPQAFNVFGPKIVASRGSYEDKGLESRFLTEEMGARPMRDDIPINLPPTFSDEARELRNKLLLYRFHRLEHTMLDESLADPTLEPRLNQVLMPLLSIVNDPRRREELRAVAREAQAQIVAERGFSMDAQVLEVTAEMVQSPQRAVVPLADIVRVLNIRYRGEYDRPITNRWVGAILRNRLKLKPYKSHGVYVLPLTQRSKIELLCKRYGVSLMSDTPGTAVQSGDVGTSGTSPEH